MRRSNLGPSPLARSAWGRRRSSGNSSPSTSYANAGGSGNRNAVYAATTTTGTVAGGVDKFFNGLTTNEAYLSTFSIGHRITIDHGSGVSKVIDELRWRQSAIGAQGTWKLQGSNNGTDWTDVGSSFTPGTSADQTISVSGNTNGYRYHSLTLVSGASTSSPYVTEIDFKIAQL